MEKKYTLEDRVYDVKKLMRIREDDYTDFHEYCVRQIVKLTAELDDLEKHLVKVDAAILQVLMATSREEVETIVEEFTTDADALD